MDCSPLAQASVRADDFLFNENQAKSRHSLQIQRNLSLISTSQQDIAWQAKREKVLRYFGGLLGRLWKVANALFTVNKESDHELTSILRVGNDRAVEAQEVIAKKKAGIVVAQQPCLSLSRKQRWLLGGALLAGGGLGATYHRWAPTNQGKGTEVTTDMPLQEKESAGQGVWGDPPDFSWTLAPGDLLHTDVVLNKGENADVLTDEEIHTLETYLQYFIPQSDARDVPVEQRIRRSVNPAPSIKPLLGKIAERAKLPASDKDHVISSIQDQFYHMARQHDHVLTWAEKFMIVDALLLTMGEKSSPYRVSYQKISKRIRLRLEKFSDKPQIKDYLSQTPFPFTSPPPLATIKQKVNKYLTQSNRVHFQDVNYFGEKSTSLDSLIEEVCRTKMRYLYQMYKIPPLDEMYNVTYTRVTFRGLRYYAERFTIKEIFLGAHKRHYVIAGYDGMTLNTSGSYFVRGAFRKKPDITEHISAELIHRVELLKKNDNFKQLYQDTIEYRTLGMVIRFLDKSDASPVSSILQRFINNQVKPHVVKLHDKIIPNLIALSEPALDDVIYISLSYSEVSLFKRDSVDEAHEAFVRKHISIFDNQKLPQGGLKPKQRCELLLLRNKANFDFCRQKALTYEYHDDYQIALYHAMLSQIEMNIDSITYTYAEYERDSQLFYMRNTLALMGTLAGMSTVIATGPAGVAVMATIGAVIGIGEVNVNYQIANNTDDGTVYQDALEQAELGAWFTATGIVFDYAIGMKPIISQFNKYKQLRLQKTRFKYSDNHSQKKIKNRKIEIHPEDNAVPNRVDNKLPKRKGDYVLNDDSVYYYDYGIHPEFTALKNNAIPTIGKVGYRTVGDGSYVQFYTKSSSLTPQSSKTLVVSAHGGYFSMDAFSTIELPPELTINMLTPHDTYLQDPGLYSVLNANKNFKPYLAIKNGRCKVNFVSQINNNEWLGGESFNPNAVHNALGTPNGLINYRHLHYERDTPEVIADALINNRLLVQQEKAVLGDVLIVNSHVRDFDSALEYNTNIDKVLTLIKKGELKNAAGEPYQEITFSHCRVNFGRGDLVKYSTYEVIFPAEGQLTQATKVARVIQTTFLRSRNSNSYLKHEKDIGEIAFVPVAGNV